MGKHEDYGFLGYDNTYFIRQVAGSCYIHFPSMKVLP